MTAPHTPDLRRPPEMAGSVRLREVRAGMTTARRSAAAELSIIGRLTERLHGDGIRYCHWKSNHTLDESLDGLIDVDLLVDPAAAGPFAGILAALEFKPMTPPAWFAYPAIGHFIALDRAAASLVHLHVYHQLITGEGHLKGYHLPWEDVVLATRKFDPQRGIYVTDPDVEMVLFMVRSALKLRTHDQLLRSPATPCFRNHVLAEFRWLRERTNASRVVELGRELLGAEAARRLPALLDSRPTLRRLLAFRRTVIAALHPYRRYGPLEAIWHRWLKEWYSVWGIARLRRLRPLVPFTRIPVTGGRMIAFIGPDGSGKTTLTKAIVAWLSGRVDVLPIYFGSGDGSVSPVRWPLQLASRWWRRRAASTSPGRPRAHTTAAGAAPLWMRIGRALWALTLSYEKRAKLRQAWRAHERGIIVLCDRFPQNLVMGYMDGPLLSHWRTSRSGLLRALARWEGAPYEWAAIHPPDLVIRLDVAPEVAVTRKADGNLAGIQKRAEASRLMRYPRHARLIAVDASGTLDSLLRWVKIRVWDAI
jgi:hypothetical protein